MGQPPGQPFAYLFERFPSFTQTFCFREVLEMRRQGVLAPIFAIRDPGGEPRQDFPKELDGLTTYLPGSFDEALKSDAFRRAARRALADLRALWGDEQEKRRIYEALWLAPELRRRGVEHVHVHFAGIAARTAFWLKRLAGIRYSFTAHANDIFCDESPERLEMLIREAEVVVTVSDFSVHFLKERFPTHAQKVRRVYNGIHLEHFRLAEPNPTRPLILAVGRYIEKKGFLDLIAACRRLGDRPFECLIVGQGPLEEELRLAAKGDARIQITGPRGEEEIIALLSRASVFALPCVNELAGGKDNLPTVLMEAMAAATPIVSTPVAGVPEMVEEGRTGFLVPEHDVAGLAARLGELLDDPARAREMGAAGRRLCEERFATERTTTDLAAVLRDCGAFAARPTSWWRRMLG